MKKIIIVLLAFGSISAFAGDQCERICKESSKSSILNNIRAEFLNGVFQGRMRDSYSRTCVVSAPDKAEFFKSKINGVEVVGYNSQGQISNARARSEERYFKEHGRRMPTSSEKEKSRKVAKQDLEIQQKLIECDLSL